MNSFRSVERAIAFEIERQAAALDAGEPLVQETRGWSEERGETYRMRVKETSDDYRYFPEPDLPPLHLDAAWLARIRAALPELPAARRTRYRDDARAEPVRRGGPRGRPGRLGAVRGDAGRRPGPRARSPSRTGSPASTCGSATRRPSPVRRGPGRARGDRRGGRVRVDLPGPTAARCCEAHAAVGRGRAAIIADAGLPPDLRQRLGRAPRSTTSSRPTRPRSPTIAPARRRRSASSSARS